jgi:teichuronic acid exporter
MSQEGSHDHDRMDVAFVGGLAWSAGAKWLTQIITWASVLVAARILSPADFGLVEMAGFVVGLTNILAEFGIGMAVMQMHELDRRVLAQLNTVCIALCTLAFFGSAASASLIAAFFRSEQLERMIVVTSVCFFITGFQSVPQGLLQRDMDYRRLSLAEAAMSLIQAVVTVGCAVLGAGYWALIAGVVVGKGTSALLTSYWKPIPLALPRWKEVLAPLRFGWQVAVGRLAGAAYTQADGIVVGRTMGNAPLGSYRLALNLATAPGEKISMLIMRVAGPLFAKIQNDRALVRRYFLIVTESLALTVFPITFGLAVTAPEVVHVVLGPQWAAAVVPLRWLALFMGLRTMSGLLSQVLTSLRYTAFCMWISMLSLAVMPVSFYFASRWGLGAVAACWLALSPVTVGPLVLMLRRAISLPWRDYLDAVLPALLASAAMVAGLMAIRISPLPGGWPVSFSLAVQVVAGGAIYGTVLMLGYRERVLRYVRFFRQLRKKRDLLATADL